MIVMKDKTELLLQNQDTNEPPRWKLDDRTRRIGLKQVAIARLVLLEKSPSSPRASGGRSATTNNGPRRGSTKMV